MVHTLESHLLLLEEREMQVSVRVHVCMVLRWRRGLGFLSLSSLRRQDQVLATHDFSMRLDQEPEGHGRNINQAGFSLRTKLWLLTLTTL